MNVARTRRRLPGILLAAIAVMAVLSACEGPQEVGGGGASTSEVRGSEPDVNGPDVNGMVLEVTVGPEMEDCVGSAPMRCLVVDGELFYDSIEGFEHDEGYEYRLRIERYEAWPGEEPPQDASRYGYRLIEEVGKERADR